MALVLALACGGRAPGQRPDVPIVVVSIDTLRADRLPVYGYSGVETPAIERLRADAILFENAYTAVPLTLPAHVSVLTGLQPPAHGVRDNVGYRFDASRHDSLPRLLGRQGYATAAAVSSYVLRGSTGLAAAFDHYDDVIEVRSHAGLGELERSGLETVERAWSWLEPRATAPFFLMVHLYEPHAPYAAPEPFTSRFADAYDAEVAAADAALGVLIDRLRRSGVYDRALVVVLADHGEGLGDHGEQQHGVFLYRETLRVPLLLKLPGNERAGESVARPVHLVDVLPTVVELLGLEEPADGLAGVSLLDQEVGPRRLYGETFYPRLHLGWSGLRSLVDERYQFIEAPRPELYDLRADPGQTTNVLERERAVSRSMRDQLVALDPELEAPSDVDPEEARKLAALGYLSSSVGVTASELPDPKDGLPALGEIQRALDLGREGRHEEAISVLQALVAHFPAMLDARFNLGEALRAAGRPAEALEQYRRAVELAPVAANGSLLAIARIHLEQGRLEEAEEHARSVLGRLPVEANDVLARTALARGDLETALAHARLAVDAEPVPRVDSMMLLARLQTAAGSFEDALSMLDAVAARERERGAGPIPGLEYERGEALARSGRSREAAAAFQREIEDFPADVRAYSKLAFVYAVLNEFDRIDPLLERMASADPRRETLLLVADTAERLGDTEGARTWRLRAERAPSSR